MLTLMPSNHFILNGLKLLLGLLAVTTTSMAHSSEFSITPFAGYRISDSLEDDVTTEVIDLDETSSFGFILSTRRDRQSTYDFYFSRQDTVLQSTAPAADNMGVRIDYYHIGGTVDYKADNLHPFASGGLGFTRVTASDQDLSAETRLSLSIGGGLKLPVTEDATLRFEGRVLGTAIRGDGSILCANGKCTAMFNGEFFLQFEVNAGLSIAF